MRIVIVHGRAAEMEIPALMEAAWAASLRYGLSRINATVDAASLDVRLAFYGDLWRADLRQPLPRIEPVPEEQEGFPSVGEISLWVDQHLGFGDVLLELLLRDVDGYFSEPELRAATNQRLVDAVTAAPVDPAGVVVVGFSMGSLVAYDTLRQRPDLPVGALVTIGSPLAMPSFYRRLAGIGPTPFPEQLRMWVNVWTRDDPATAGHMDFPLRFPPGTPGGPLVQDLETWGRSASATNPAAAHNAMDYLGSRVFAKALVTGIAAAQGGDE
ncbi:MAG TPA: hypothetical protein VES19_13875 [Candidatus Limnocylindrales bacterium]|nr:hypothetical protein [Candidatus Limnocylindrales bacterium]